MNEKYTNLGIVLGLIFYVGLIALVISVICMIWGCHVNVWWRISATAILFMLISAMLISSLPGENIYKDE